MAQAFALGPDPGLERLLLEAEAVEQVALVERDRALQGVGRRLRDEVLEQGGVQVNVRSGERDLVAAANSRKPR